MFRRTLLSTVGAALLASALPGVIAVPAQAQSSKVTIALPGIPPVYSVIITYVADKQGFYKKYGANVELRPFDNGTAAARAVVAGDVDMAWSPTPPVINQISNAEYLTPPPRHESRSAPVDTPTTTPLTGRTGRR